MPITTAPSAATREESFNYDLPGTRQRSTVPRCCTTGGGMLFWKQSDATTAAAWAATVTDPVMRVKLQLSPLPRPETEPVLPGP